MKYDHEILLLQGGGALGAYQAGVYEGLVEAGHEPSWVVGISIGAINAALIVGNPPERRVERLREFWRRIAVNVGPPFNAQGELPRNLSQVSERAKDIQYASKTRFNVCLLYTSDAADE